MDIACRCRIVVTIFAALTAGPAVATDADTKGPLGAEERQQIESGLRAVSARLQTLKRDATDRSAAERDRLADAEVFGKGITWALKYDVDFVSADLKLLKTALDRFLSRVNALEAGKSPWFERKGKVVRGFVSAVDGSIQPYAVIIPAHYDPAKPMRLDVVLHGSSKPVGMSELRFMARFDDGEGPAANAPDRDYIELHPLGRVENGYRWAGETDVFEAIEAVCRNYAVDRHRIVLRGMSMGASGTWHLGLKQPDRFVALGPYCGYVDTHEFSKTPLPNFVEVGPLPAEPGEGAPHARLGRLRGECRRGTRRRVHRRERRILSGPRDHEAGDGEGRPRHGQPNLSGHGPCPGPDNARRADAAHRRSTLRKGWSTSPGRFGSLRGRSSIAVATGPRFLGWRNITPVPSWRRGSTRRARSSWSSRRTSRALPFSRL